MLQIGRINNRLSSNILKMNKDILQPTLCYNNVFELTHRYFDRFVDERFKIAYGYWGNPELNLIRHCYIIDNKDRIIDPSILMLSFNSNLLSNAGYFTFAKLTYEEYIKLSRETMRKMKTDEFEPDLKLALKEQEYKFYKFALKNDLPIYQESYELYLKDFEKGNEQLNVVYI
jgi:hypothetical protein